MKFLNINDDTKKQIDELNHHIQQKDKIFILFYMNGCGPCEATRPEWKKIQNVLEDKYAEKSDYIIVDIDQNLMSKIKNLKDTPQAFPTIRYMQGNEYKQYEKNRDVDSFVEWIEDNMMQKQNGGIKMTKKTRKTRKTRRMKKNKRKVTRRNKRSNMTNRMRRS